jgi:hypothetical protein
MKQFDLGRLEWRWDLALRRAVEAMPFPLIKQAISADIAFFFFEPSKFRMLWRVASAHRYPETAAEHGS